MAGEQPKKPTGGGYGQFLTENRPKFTEECKGQKASAVAQLAGQRWKAMTDAQKKPFDEKYKKAKEKFDKDMAAFEAAGGEKAPRKRKADKEGKGKKKKDPNAPKKPAGGAYGRFLNKNRPAFTEQCKGQSITAVSKLAGAKWKALSAAEKEPFEKEYQIAQAAYTKAMEAYKKSNPTAGADDDDAEEDADDAEEEEEDEDEEPVKKKPASK